MREDPGHSWHDDTPFPRRWKGYLAIKLVVLALAILLAFYLIGLL